MKHTYRVWTKVRWATKATYVYAIAYSLNEAMAFAKRAYATPYTDIVRIEFVF